jgi:hypothetical protein
LIAAKIKMALLILSGKKTLVDTAIKKASSIFSLDIL